MSLRWRLALVLAIIVAGTVAVVATASYVSTRQELEQGIDDFLRTQVDDILRAPRRRGREQPPPGLPEPTAPGTVLQEIRPDGEVVDTTDGVDLPVDSTDVAVASGDQGTALRTVSVDGVDYRVLTAPTNDGAVQIARDISETQATLDGLRQRLIGVGLLGTALAALLGWVVASRFTRPIERLTVASEQVASTQDLSPPIEVDRSDEVGRLARSFNAMLEALDRSRRQQEQLVMDASHELRTPLTTLRTNIELLDRAPDLPDDERRQIVAAATVELEELTALVTELVDLATEQRAEDLEVEEVDLGALASDVVERARHRTGREITLDLDDPATVSGAPTLLARAVSNLLDNASKFSPDDTPLAVRVDGGTVVVTDHGPGIPDDDRERVFDRFYRTDAARTLPGSGLGLAIVRQIVDDHGGSVRIDDAPGGGAQVTLELPTAPAAS